MRPVVLYACVTYCVGDIFGSCLDYGGANKTMEGRQSQCRGLSTNDVPLESSSVAAAALAEHCTTVTLWLLSVNSPPPSGHFDNYNN